MIDSRFRGPSGSANGGYTCGLVASCLGSGAEVTLRLPPPLDTAMDIVRDGESARLLLGDALVAEGRIAEVELEVPQPPSLDEARAAEANYPGFVFHPFPECFVCGPQRAAGDGLRVFPSPLGNELFASTWTLPEGFGDPAPSTITWAALDCPGGWGIGPLMDAAEVGIPWVLGRMTARLVGELHPGEHLSIGWPISREGRKSFAGSALFDSEGELIGFSKQTWIQLK